MMLPFQHKTLIRCVIHFTPDVAAALGLSNFCSLWEFSKQNVYYIAVCYTCEVNNLYHNGTSLKNYTLQS